jgi:hypothetical protein
MGYTETQWGADWEGGFHRNKEVMVSREGWIWFQSRLGTKEIFKLYATLNIVQYLEL